MVMNVSAIPPSTNLPGLKNDKYLDLSTASHSTLDNHNANIIYPLDDTELQSAVASQIINGVDISTLPMPAAIPQPEYGTSAKWVVPATCTATAITTLAIVTPIIGPASIVVAASACAVPFMVSFVGATAYDEKRIHNKVKNFGRESTAVLGSKVGPVLTNLNKDAIANITKKHPTVQEFELRGFLYKNTDYPQKYEKLLERYNIQAELTKATGHNNKGEKVRIRTALKALNEQYVVKPAHH